MGRGEYEKRWMAYIDGQLSTGEASAFDASLDAEARLRVEAEMRFESVLGERLASGPGCPDELWRKTLSQLEAAPSQQVTRFPRRIVVLAAAAGLVLTVGMGASFFSATASAPSDVVPAMEPAGTQMARLAISEETVSDFALRAKTPCSPQAIERFLEDHDIQLALVSEQDSRLVGDHRVRLLGSCMGNCPKGEIVEVMFDFDGSPAKLVLAHANSGGAKLIRNEEQKGTVSRTKVVGEYVAGVVYRGENVKDTEMLLEMIRVKNEQFATKINLNQITSTLV